MEISPWSASVLVIVVVFVGVLVLYGSWNDSRHHHRWGKWGEPKLVEILVNGKITGGQARFQERYCETCGEGESRRMVP
jgi:hypothetical protein